MPEGVEVKLSADIIKPLMVGQVITDAYSTPNSRYAGTDPDDHKAFKKSLSGAVVQVVDIQTKGKFMYWSFTNNWYLMCTFGMTGQWSPTKGKHPCFVFQHHSPDGEIGENKQMVFNDPRHFGTIKFTDSYHVVREKLLELGWDPLAHPFATHERFITSHLASTKYANKTIGEVLMDQSLFAGVGNYIRAEALYEAGISPRRQCRGLANTEIKKLCEAIVRVMKDSYAHQGATILTYKDAYGAEGKYSSCFKVYGKERDPLGNKIVKENSPEGRTIHWCPSVQV
jgi:formamidopyrimidine-DNA glycosylase